MIVEEAKRVLVVDDDPGIRRTMRRMLARSCEVLEAESCERALSLLDRDADGIDVVVLDLTFPAGALQGHEALTRMQARWPHLPVVVVTGAENDSPEARSRLGSGAFCFLSKWANLTDTLPRAVRDADQLHRRKRGAPAVAPASGPAAVSAAPEPPPERPGARGIRPFAQVKRECFLDALAACSGDMSEAARRLEVPYEAYRDQLAAWGVLPFGPGTQ